MGNLEINQEFIRANEYDDIREDIEQVTSLNLFKTMVIFSGGAFRNCKKLEEVFFGLDITRIGNGTFIGCDNLTDVWFAITDEDKIIEIAEDAFDECKKEITFHIFGSAIKNKYLTNYAKRHGFRVEGMM